MAIFTALPDLHKGAPTARLNIVAPDIEGLERIVPAGKRRRNPIPRGVSKSLGVVALITAWWLGTS